MYLQPQDSVVLHTTKQAPHHGTSNYRGPHVNMSAVSNEQVNDNGLLPGDGAGSSAAAAVIVDVNSAALEVCSTRTHNTSACVLRCIPKLAEAVARHKIPGRLVVPVEGLEELDSGFAPEDLTAEQ